MPRSGSVYPLLDTMGFDVARLSAWIDGHNASKGAEAVTLGRMIKVAEEFGEMVGALIAHTGQNPRKPREDRTDELVKENLDIALTALGNVEHLTGNAGRSLVMLLGHIGNVVARAEANGMGYVHHVKMGQPFEARNGDTVVIHPSQDELPGLWEPADFEGGQTDVER